MPFLIPISRQKALEVKLLRVILKEADITEDSCRQKYPNIWEHVCEEIASMVSAGDMQQTKIRLLSQKLRTSIRCMVTYPPDERDATNNDCNRPRVPTFPLNSFLLPEITAQKASTSLMLSLPLNDALVQKKLEKLRMQKDFLDTQVMEKEHERTLLQALKEQAVLELNQEVNQFHVERQNAQQEALRRKAMLLVEQRCIVEEARQERLKNLQHLKELDHNQQREDEERIRLIEAEETRQKHMTRAKLQCIMIETHAGVAAKKREKHLQRAQEKESAVKRAMEELSYTISRDRNKSDQRINTLRQEKIYENVLALHRDKDEKEQLLIQKMKNDQFIYEKDREEKHTRLQAQKVKLRLEFRHALDEQIAEQKKIAQNKI